MTEATAFGVALAAGLTAGLWDLKDHSNIPFTFERYENTISEDGKMQK